MDQEKNSEIYTTGERVRKLLREVAAVEVELNTLEAERTRSAQQPPPTFFQRLTGTLTESSPRQPTIKTK